MYTSEQITLSGTGWDARHDAPADYVTVVVRRDGEPGERWVVWPVVLNPRFAADDPQRRAEHADDDDSGLAIARAEDLTHALELALQAIGQGEEGCLR